MKGTEAKAAGPRLADLVEESKEALLQEWTQAIERNLAPKPMTKPELLDSLPVFLDDLVAALRGAIPLRLAADASKEHGSQRFREGFDIESVAREYGVLRSCLFEMMRQRSYSPTLDEMAVVSKCLTDGIAVAISQYAQEREAEVTNRSDFEKQLLGIVSHDLRDPLNVIALSAGTMLRRNTLDELELKGLSRILSSAKHATRLISDLLDFTQARVGGGIPIRPKVFNFHDLTRQIVDEVRLAHPDRQIALTRSGNGEGEWDPDRVTQVIFNLIGNALQHGPAESPVWVSTREESNALVLEVKNRGGTVSAEEIPALFEPFHHGPNAGRRRGSVGLGLFIAREIALAHGGSVDVQSTAEEGTAFVVRWPRREQPRE